MPPKDTLSASARALIEQLGLIAHPEGGYFRETFRSFAEPMKSRGSTDQAGTLIAAYDEGLSRNLLTSIYWMPTSDSPMGWLCSNRAPHIHYYHAGSSLTYHLISPMGELTRHTLGPNLAAGDVLQLIVPGDTWKAAHLENGEYCLLGEAVAPGFDSADFALISEARLVERFPQHRQLARFTKPSLERHFESYYDD